MIANLNYTYDKNDNRKTESKNFGQDTLTTEYDFDVLNRAAEIRYPAQYNETAKTVNYTFDAANNRKTETAKQGGKTTHKVYDYNDLDQLKNITTTGGQDIDSSATAYTYDDNGSVSQKIVTEKVVTQNIGGASPDTTSTSAQTTTTGM